VVVVPDQRNFDALLGEEALVLGDEERSKPDPGEVEYAQRLGLGRTRRAGK
jgi:hypothetical protein